MILSIDWLFFGAESISLGLATPVAAVAAFVVAGVGVFITQRRSNDGMLPSALKALFGGVVAGIPTSIGGTVLATLVLLLAGIRGHR